MKFCEISTLLLTGTTQDNSKVEISQIFVAFSEYMNFTTTVIPDDITTTIEDTDTTIEVDDINTGNLVLLCHDKK